MILYDLSLFLLSSSMYIYIVFSIVLRFMSHIVSIVISAPVAVCLPIEKFIRLALQPA